MKKRYWVYVSIVVIALLYVLCKHTILYVWVNPYTETSGMQSISPVVYRMNTVLDKARKFSHDEGYDYKYSYFNLYGSGFMKNNPVPNDLDTEVGLYLGEYTYNGKNGNEIAENILGKIESFLFAFYYYMNTEAPEIQSFVGAFDQLAYNEKIHEENMGVISNSLEDVVNKRNHITYSDKVFELNKTIHKVDYPYSMEYNEILLTNSPNMTFFTDKLAYNKRMLRYPREVSVIMEYKFDLKYKDEVIETKIIPESFFGARLNLTRRFFASSAYVNRYSGNFLKKEPILNDKDAFNFYRMISYKRHIAEIDNIIETDYSRAHKVFKRLMQTVDMVQPLVSKDKYDEIASYIYNNLSNRDMQLLNEYDNMQFMLKKYNKNSNLMLHYIKNGTIQKMYDMGLSILDELYQRGNVDKKYLDVLTNFQNTKFKQLLIGEIRSDIMLEPDDDSYEAVAVAIGNAMTNEFFDTARIEEYVKFLTNVYGKAGYHKIYMYWLDNHTIGYIEDDFTRGIKDVKKFARENDLAEDFDYKMIKPSQIPEITLRYDFWVRNNPTPEEEENYKKLKAVYAKDRNNFKIKHKLGFAFVW